MRTRFAGMLASAGAVAASLAMATSASAAPSTPLTKLTETAAPAAATTPSVGAVAGSTRMSFEMDLALSDPAGAAAFTSSVSDPSSASYRQYLTAAQWEARFSPTTASVSQVTQFLTSKGFTVSGVSPDRMAVSASGSAAKIEKVFGTQLSFHQVAGQKVILNDTELSVPTAIAPLLDGVTGISQTIATPSDTTGATKVAGISKTTPGNQPAGFRNARPCSAYYGEQLAAAFPKLAGGYPNDAPYAPCGYTPPQIRSAYGLTDANTGSGVTVAIIDAYASPTLYSDAAEYASDNDPGNPLTQSQFSELLSPTFNDGALCGGKTGWYGEQTLDVEAVHATAPGAHILFAGAENCAGGLDTMLRQIVDGHLADIISNSYGDTGGDLLSGSGYRNSTDDILEMAADTGISVLYSTGDDGDNYDQIGAVSPDYPASSPYATAVGGTTLQIGAEGQRLAENGWSTGRAVFCNTDYKKVGGCTAAQLQTWLPLSYDYGAGGGTSYDYIQPSYQVGVVPNSLSEVRTATPMRVIPDVSMDADPSTGFLVGETQTFPDGTYYDQYRIGGTSLASPLLAGTVARADQAAGSSAGFLNPALYSLAGNATAIDDITPPASPEDTIRADYLDDVDSAFGIYYSARTINYQGSESFCVSATSCTTRETALYTARGYDNMTGIGSPGAGFVAALAH
jgi:subtilase family serine protease